MITVIKKNASEQQISNLISWFESKGFKTNLSKGEFNTIIGIIGDVSKVDDELVSNLEIVESVTRIGEKFKMANRKFHDKDYVANVGGVLIGGGNFQIIAGPCAVESEEQVLSVAESVKNSGAALLRGGAFKPRTSPHDFQGKGDEGINILTRAKEKTGMPIVTEIMSADKLDFFEEKDVDLIQVGARNMQNFELLKALQKSTKPILLKRGLANTIDEWLMSAEYIMAAGKEDVILCERGIRTFETRTRNTLDLSAVPVLKSLTHLPIIVDPSHAIGYREYVKPMALAAAACGADGLIIEVHNDPPNASCDGRQSLTPEQFDDLMKGVVKMRKVWEEIK